MNAIYNTSTGALVSLGTVMANPLPAGLTSVALSQTDYDNLQRGSHVWSEASRSVVADPAWVDPAIAEGNRSTIETNLLQDLVAMQALIDATNNSINSNPAAHLKSIARCLRRIIRHELNILDGTV